MTAPQDGVPQEWFVFLSVDVIEHTERLRNAFNQSNYDFREFDEALNGLQTMTRNAIPDFTEDMEWDWAGDGGIYAFPAQEETVAFARAIDAAELIIAKLCEFNLTLELFAIRAKSKFAERGSTMLDSNLDRTRRFLDGWLLQWEAVLFPLDKKPDLPGYVRDLLMTYSPPESAE